MTIDFKFELGSKVLLPSGIVGTVETNSQSVGHTEKEIYVEYFDKNGAMFGKWFRESEVRN